MPLDRASFILLSGSKPTDVYDSFLRNENEWPQSGPRDPELIVLG